MSNTSIPCTRAASAWLVIALAVIAVACSPQEPASGAEDAAGAPAAEPAFTSQAEADAAGEVATRAGMLRGRREDRIYKFKGVHYGASTAGERRFLPPEPVPAWDGVRDATAFGPLCPQAGIVATGADENYAVGPIPVLPQSEDCLVLNVWTPGLDGDRPVMVWLHGRGFREGAGSERWYDGTRLAQRGDVVVITLNHRLNVFGYLNLADIAGAEYGGSGVAGMLDIVEALRWIRDNVAKFGGDPGNVTVFGESGGGFKVSTLLAMPDAEGLFHKAIIQSGAAVRSTESDEATRITRALLHELGVDGDGAGAVAALQTLPFGELTEAVGRLERAAAAANGGPSFGFRPVVGHRHLPAHPFDPVASPHARGVPVLIGTTADEMTLLTIGDPDRVTLTAAALEARMTAMLGEHAHDVLAVYREQRPNVTPWDLYIAIISDRAFRLPSIRLAERHGAAGGAPVYFYLFAWETDYGDPPLRAAHALEIPFVFDTADVVPLTGSRAGQDVLTDAVSGAWVAFARGGDPNHPGIPRWQPYTSDARHTLVFEVPSRAEIDPHREERLAWESVPLF
jgi:para-nitrobenzyl esterase